MGGPRSSRVETSSEVLDAAPEAEVKLAIPNFGKVWSCYEPPSCGCGPTPKYVGWWPRSVQLELVKVQGAQHHQEPLIAESPSTPQLVRR